jgi:gas vesicle protein
MGNGNGRGGGFLPGLIIGAIVGGAAAVLLSQEEMRDLLVGKVREAGNAAMDATGDLRGKVNDAGTQWQSTASELYERGKQVVDNARTNIDAAVDSGMDAAEALRMELQRKAEG